MTPPILTLPIAGMTCAACAVRLEKVLKRLPDVDAEVNFATASARLTSRTVQPPDLAAAMAAVARAGFQVPLSRQRLTLEGMTCVACAQRIEKVLNRLPGVHASVNFATASAEVDYPAGVVSSAQLLDAVRRAGYQAQLPRADTPVTSAGEQDHTGRWLLASTLLALPFVAEMLAMLAGRHGLLPVAWQWALATPVQFLVGWRFYRGAWLSLRGGGANMDVLVALGTSMAYLLSVWTALTAPHHGHVYFEASVSVITLVLLGKWLEQRARRQTAGAIEALLKLAPPRRSITLPPNRIKESAMLSQKLFDEISAKIGDTLASSPAKDLEKNLRSLMGSAFTKLDLVTREEFDVQQEVLARTREKLEQLEARLAKLEALVLPAEPAAEAAAAVEAEAEQAAQGHS